MKRDHLFHAITQVSVVLCLAGCSTTNQKGSQTSSKAEASPKADTTFARKYRTDDNRTADVGPSTKVDGGISFKDPHMNECWIADGFDFKGYDVVYVSPTASTAQYKPEEEDAHQLIKESFPGEVKKMFDSKQLFPSVLTEQWLIKPGSRTLQLDTTIVEYYKGSGSGRFWAGTFGGGQPVLRIKGEMTDGYKTVFKFEARRSGVSAESRVGLMKSENIQIEDARSMLLDLADFIAVVQGRYQPK